MENKSNRPTRREFITTSALGIAGLSPGSSALASVTIHPILVEMLVKN